MTIRVLIADSNPKTASALAETLENRADYEVQIVHSNFETGAIVQKFAPHVLLISLLAEGIDAMDVCRGIRSNEDSQAVKILAIANRLNETEASALLHKGFDGYICYSDQTSDVIKKIEEMTAVIY